MEKFTTLGIIISRYGIVYILLAFGVFKFTATEAQSIKPFIDNSFFFNWMYHFFDIRSISRIVGVLEIIAAIGIALRAYSPLAAFYGSVLGSIIFFVTLSFLFTTPGMIAKSEWMWLPDGFIIKDLALLGFCVWSAGESFATIRNMHII